MLQELASCLDRSISFARALPYGIKNASSAFNLIEVRRVLEQPLAVDLRNIPDEGL